MLAEKAIHLLQGLPYWRCSINGSKLYYYSVGLGKRQHRNQNVAQVSSFGDWLNGVAIHSFKDYGKKRQMRRGWVAR